ncbi:MAG: PAS domain S-box protein [Deltaproteobacteria bacterium]
MKDENKTKEQLIDELIEMRQDFVEYRKNTEAAFREKEQELQNEIDNHKQAEAALLQSEEKFSKAFHFSPDTFIIVSLRDHCFIEVNDTFLNATGYKREEVIGYSSEALNIFVVPEDRDQIIKQVNEQGSIRNRQTKFRMKSGEIKTTFLSADIIDIYGEPHLICVTKNITELKRMEEALRMSEECFSKAFNASPIIMTITKLEDGKYINANNAFCNICGYSHEEAIGQTSLGMGLWVDPADRDMVKQNIMAEKPVRNMEGYFCTKTGEQRLGLYSAEIIDINGEICLFSMLTDITELRKMEVEMTRLDRLNLVGEMAASIGHEIRNPMTTVRGYLQILRENDDYKQEIKYFDLMIEEMDRANSILTEFLSLAKNKIVELKTQNLKSIIIKLLPLIQTKAIGQDQNIKLELNDVPDLLLDKEEIHQLIFNLVDNGLESMPSAGEVTIRTFIENEEVVLAVQDQGNGIDNRLLDKLGTPFLTTKEQGTGLGLAVCYRIAARHNAKIDIETSSNGTTFYVRFLGASMVR